MAVDQSPDLQLQDNTNQNKHLVTIYLQQQLVQHSTVGSKQPMQQHLKKYDTLLTIWPQPNNTWILKLALEISI